MKESRLILPQQTNNGRPTLRERLELEKALARTFGGFSCFEGSGAWDAPGHIFREPIWFFDIATEDNQATRHALREIALWIGRITEQVAVYVRHANGNVEFLSIEEQQKEAA